MRHSFRGFSLLVLPLVLPLVLLPQSTGTVLTLDDIVDEFREPPPGMEDSEWLGLFIDADGSRIEPVEVEWQSRTEVDEGAFELVTAPPQPFLLWAGVPQIEVGPAQTTQRGPIELSPDNPVLRFQFSETPYELTLEGADPARCDAIVTLTDGEDIQQVYSLADGQYSCDEPHLSVHWAGDLDGDARLDLVTTFSRKYSYYPRRMYLSSAAHSNELVRQVALFER